MGIDVRPDLAAAIDAGWGHVAAPGTWLTGVQRVAAATEARAASRCTLCATRRAAVSPYHLEGVHNSAGGLLDPSVVDAVHRIAGDASRLTRRWLGGLLATGLGFPAYVELVGLVATVTAMDVFSISLGGAPAGLPEPKLGSPTRIMPAEAYVGDEWVPVVHPAAATGRLLEYYEGAALAYPVVRALSLVSETAIGFARVARALYLEAGHWSSMDRTPRSLRRAAMEIVAVRTSALNECFY